MRALEAKQWLQVIRVSLQGSWSRGAARPLWRTHLELVCHDVCGLGFFLAMCGCTVNGVIASHPNVSESRRAPVLVPVDVARAIRCRSAQ